MSREKKSNQLSANELELKNFLEESNPDKGQLFLLGLTAFRLEIDKSLVNKEIGRASCRERVLMPV